MKKIKLLILTDHSAHSAENSLYALARTMNAHPLCDYVDVATRANRENRHFFYDWVDPQLYVSRIKNSFEFSAEGNHFKQTKLASLYDYGAILLRLPRPIKRDFFYFLTEHFPQNLIVNNPIGIIQTSSKEYLLNFPEVCPPMRLCQDWESLDEFRHQYPIVLKPLENYGGKGVIKIIDGKVDDGEDLLPLSSYTRQIEREFKNGGYLGMKYLQNVGQGDKRIIVANGEILAASLRLPADGSWLCNVAQGGTSVASKADTDEIAINDRIKDKLLKSGIVLYGYDTLVGDDGKRVLSEINTLSVGGLPQAAEQTGRPIVKQVSDNIWNYIKEAMR